MPLKFTNRDKVMAGLILVIILFFGFRECSHQEEKNELVNNVANYKDTAQYYNLKVNGMEVEVAYNKSLVLNNQKQFESVIAKNDTLLKLVKKFKSVQSGTIINNYTTINGDTIIYKKGDSIPCDFKAFKIRRDSVHYKFVGTIGKNFFSIDTLSIPNKIDLIIGRKKLGFLRRGEERAEIINSNPLVKTTNIGNYVVVSKKKRFGIGASAGYGIHLDNNILKMSPTINLSVNYNVLEF